MSNKIYKAGAIGMTGKGGYGHGLHTAYKGLSNVQFIAVTDPDEAGREKAKSETGAKSAYADYREMLDKEKLDIISVCPRWVDNHLEMVLACFEHGCHVYCEKPMTKSLEDGDNIVQFAKQAGLKIAVAHQGVYLPGTQAVKKMLDEGRIGTVQAIYSHGKQDSRGGGEDMIVLGTHLFNTMRFFVGDIDWMFAHVTTQGRDITKADAREATEPIGLIAGDCINSYFSFKSGVAGFFDSRKDQAGSDKRYGMDIVGSKGMISIRGGAADNMAIYPHPVWAPYDMSQKWEPLKIDDTPLFNGNKLAIIDLIDSIENDRKPISSGYDAVCALEMILSAYESQLTGQRIQFPMKNRKHPLES